MKRKNEKKKINKNRLIIFICALVLLVIVVAGVVVLALKIKNKKNEPAKLTGESLEKRAKDVFYNNYLISYILQDDVETGEGTLTIEGDPNVYYAVTDPLLNDIHTPEDINKLIDDNLSTEGEIRANKLLESQYANLYVSHNNTLYVKKSENLCSVYEEGKVDYSKISYTKDGNNIFVTYNNVPVRIRLNDDKNVLEAPTLWFACSRGFNYTDLSKDGQYDPNNIIEDEETNNESPSESEQSSENNTNQDIENGEN